MTRPIAHIHKKKMLPRLSQRHFIFVYLILEPTSYLYEADNGAVPQAVEEASAAHFFYRGQCSRRKNYTRWSSLDKAEKTKWTKEWTQISKVQKEQAAQAHCALIQNQGGGEG
ncbi:unnamed protein product [Caenorhabditis nigoni]